MTREDSLVLSHAVDVGLHDAAEERSVQVAGVVRVAITGGGNARVDARRVAVPHVHVDGRDGLASARVDELDVEVERHALLPVGDVAADQLAVDVVRPLGDFGLQDAG